MAFAVKELKLALEKKRLFQNEFIDIDKIIQTTRYKLSLYGLSDKQIQDIESNDNFSNILTIRSPVSGVITSLDVREGDYVMEGAGIYNIADLSSLWAEAQVYSDNLYQINDNMMATVFVPGISGVQYQGKITFVNPELNPSSTINIIRIEVPNHLQLLRPGMQINVSVLVNKKNTLAVSTDAILLTEKGAYAWIKTGNNQFKSVMVETGIVTNEYTEIKSGLMHGDIVVTSGAYLLNSEYLFNKGTDLMEGHNMKME